MPRRLLRILVVISVCLFSTAAFSQSAPPAADTFANKLAPNKNYGSATALVVEPGVNSYLKFNLATLPAGVAVTKATLRLYVDSVSAAGAFDVYQLNTGWIEGTLTYSNAPPLGPSATNNNPITVSASKLNQFVVIDITPLVQGWANGGIPNRGVALALVGNSGVFSFDSKENAFTSHHPELEIALSGPAGTQGPQGPQGPTGANGGQGSMGLPGPQGPAGTNGTNGIDGTNGTGFNFTGAFDPAANYNAYDVVTYQGSTYDATTAIASGAGNPDANPQWSLMAQAGAAGATGPSGAPGPQGPIGDTGPQGPIGVTGAPGQTGQNGAPGPQGPTGMTGPQGDTGDTGGRMIFPTFFPGNLSGTWLGGKFVLDRAITVLRMAITVKTPTDPNCASAVFRFTDGSKGQDLVLATGQNWSDSGPIVLTFAAGATLQASLRTGVPTCEAAVGGDANMLVEYKMRAQGDTDSCLGTACSGICTVLTGDPANCGNCGNVCPGNDACAAGTCSPPNGCGTGQALCAGQCVYNATDPLNCGACGQACQPGEACLSGACSQTACSDGVQDGNETDVDCGGGSCPRCADGAHCSVGSDCLFFSCSTIVKGGSSPVCSLRKGGCPPGTTLCSDGCYDLSSDRYSCGACGQVCQVGQSCVSGVCQLSCSAGQTQCGGQCINTSTDPNNCGACGLACQSGQGCANGACFCLGGLINCGTGCLDLATDPSNCGACGVICGSGQQCIAGVCN